MPHLAEWKAAFQQYIDALLNADRETATSFYLHLLLITNCLLWLISPTEHLQPVYSFLVPALLLLVILNRQKWFPRGLAAWTMITMISAAIAYGAMKAGGPSSLFLLVFAAIPAPIFWMLGPRALWPMVVLFVTCIAAIVVIYVELGFPAPMERRAGTAILVILISGLNLFALPSIAQSQLQRIVKDSEVNNLALKNAEACLLDQQTRQDIFVASVSHALRTPMHAIMGMLQTSDHMWPKQARENKALYESMRHSARHLMTVINDLLDFSQIQSGQLRIHPRPMPLRQLLFDLKKMFEDTLEIKGVAMHLEVESSVPDWIVADSDRLTQVIINILGNAAKFTQEGKIELAASYTPTKILCVSVSDTGLGIPANQLHQAFERFTPLADKTRHQYGGTGLGLSISRNIIELMGGGLHVTSELGHGSRFWFEVPAQPHLPPHSVEGAKNASGCEEIRARILIVDDSEINRLVARRMLSQALPMLEILECADGLAAVRLSTLSSIDLILMDVVMPVMDGIEATKIIRARSDAPTVIALTADISASTRNECAEAGMEGIIFKPYDTKLLIDSVVASLQKRRIGAAQSPMSCT